MSSDDNEEIAIVGIGCRFPGANNIDEFWRVLENAENHVCDIPGDRWNNDKFYSKNPDEKGKIYVNKAGLLSEHDKWDNRLFGISDDEAVRIDPQQRYVLECTHMALEDGGFTRKRLSGTKTGVFIGVMNDDYKTLVGTDHREDTNLTATGLSTTVIASRVAYVYNLQGPCMTIDTACSSAMMALHLGCQAIRTGDCDIAICGGVNSILSPDMFIPLCKARMLSSIGQCQTFCDTADGYARGEGCGIVILQSMKNGSRIEKLWGVLQTGINQDGRATSPMTAPSSEQQQKLLHAIYKKCKIDPRNLDYIEVHGTGTPVGDPTEVDAISTFIKSYSVNKHELNPSRKILMGSVKTNVGHTESAAAVAGLIKVLLMMKHEKFVKSLHIQDNKSNINKRITLNDTALDISVKVQNWHKNQLGNRIASVNSFGFGGSNGHAIVKQFSDRYSSSVECSNSIKSESVLFFVCLYGRDRKSLSNNINSFINDADSSPERPSDVSYTSIFCRDAFEHRSLLFGASLQDMCKHAKMKMESVGEAVLGHKRNIIMVFCGVGTTWSGMGAEMLANHSVFRHTVQKIDQHLKLYTSLCIEDIFTRSLDYTDPVVNHISIFTMQVALYELWKSLGVTPDTIIGQSVGEVAAAYASGALTLSSAVKVIFYRATILAQQTKGKMLVVGNIALSEIERLCSKYQGSIHIAVYNSPSSCTVSGTETAIDSLEEDLRKYNGSFIRSLKVPCAYHSHLMDVCLSEIINKITDLENGREPQIPQLSTVTCRLSDREELATSRYWAENVRQPVLFMQAVRKTVKIKSTNVYLEIGPRQVLKLHLPNIMKEETKFLCLPSMNQNDEKCFYRSLTTLFELGIDIDFSQLIPYRGDLSPLPRYHFNKTTSLFISPSTKQYLSGFANSRGTQTFLEQVSDKAFNVLLNLDTTPWIFDHQLLGTITVPGATYVEAAITGACEVFERPANALKLSVSFENPCMIETDQTTLLYMSFWQNAEMEDRYFTYSVRLDERTLCTGIVSERKTEEYNVIDVDALKMRLTKQKTAEEIYGVLEKIGLRYGDSLRLIEYCYYTRGECLAVIKLPQSVRRDTRMFCLHPAIVDAMFQTSGVLSAENSTRSYEGIPIGFKSLITETPPREHMLVYTRLVRSTRIKTFYKLILCSLQGSIIAEIDDLVIRSMDASVPNDSISYEIKWRQLEQLTKMEQMDIPFDNDRQLTVFGSKRFQCWLSRGKVSFNFIEIPNDPNMFQQLVTDGIRNSPKGSRVVFGPCINCHHLEGQNSKVIYNMVVSNIIFLQMIFKVKKSVLGDTFPVSIVTESTQQLSNHASENTNYLGAELWGFTRSAMTEMPFEDISLIDAVLEEENINPFILLVTNTEKGPTESLIRNGLIYVSEIRLSHTQDIEYIDSKQRETMENLHLCSASSNGVSQLLLTYTLRGHDHRMKVTNGILTNMLVARLVINRSHRIEGRSCIRTITMDHQASPDARVKAIELQGWLKKDIDMENSGKLYGICFPVTVSTVITVPKCCIFLLKDIPFYKPGLVSEVVILWQVLKQIKHKSNVLIVASDKECWRAKVMLDILRYCRSSGAVVSWGDLDDIASSREIFTHAVLVQFEHEHNISLLNNVTDLKRVIWVKEWLPWDSMSDRLPSSLSLRTVALTTEDIMTADSLIKLVPVVLNYLIKGTSDLKSTSPKIMEKVDLSYGLIDVQTAPFETNLPVFQYPSSLFKNDGHYIFVGGTSGLGWELLQYCAELGAGNLITLSRSGLSDNKAAKMKKIERVYGCSIKHIQADVTDSESIYGVFDTLRKNHVNVKGIFHGGGVLKDILLENMTAEHLETALKPKVLGTLNLFQVSKNLQLDFFVTHSSITAIFGNQGQCNYAAGNSFQDSFAHFGANRGYKTQSINWGALPFGMAKESMPDFESRFRRQGIHVLNANDVKSCFNEMILTKDTQKIFGIFDWKTLIENPMYSSSRSKFESILQNFGIIHKSPLLQSEEMNKITADFLELSLEKQTEALTKIVLASLKDSLMAEIEILDFSSGIFQLGIDSMSAMSISNSIFQNTRVRVPVVFLLSNTTTIQGLIDFVHDELISHKETEETVNEESVHYDIFDGSVSFMQASILNGMEIENPSNFIRTISYEMISRRISNKEWIKIIIQLLQIHPGLRQVFEWNANTKKFQAKEIDIDEFNVPVKIVPFKTIFETAVGIHMDPRHQIPIMLHLSCKGRMTRMIVFLHAVVVDMQNVNILFRDLELCARHHFSGGPKPLINSLNVTETIRQVLTPRFGEMKTFWKQTLSRNIEPFSFSNSLSDVLDETRWCEVGHIVSEEQFDDILNFIRRKNVTLYNFVLTVYFLVIYELTGLEVIPVITNTNIRGFVPELENVLTRCINEIPVIGLVKPDSPVNEYLRESAVRLNEMTEHGAYPFDLIKEEMSSDSLRHNIGRHRFIVDDISAASKRLETKDVTVKIAAIRHRRHTYETCLFMHQDTSRKKLILDLGFNSDAVGKSFAKDMIERIVCLLLRIVHENSIASVGEIFNVKSNYLEVTGENNGSKKTPFVWEQSTETSTGNSGALSSIEYSTTDLDKNIREKGLKEIVTIINGQLEKQSNRGPVYKTKVVLIRSNAPNSTEYYICWKYLLSSRQINVKDITEIHIKKIAGKYSLFIKKDQAWIQFVARDLSEATTWFNHLQNVKEHIHDFDAERSTHL